MASAIEQDTSAGNGMTGGATPMLALPGQVNTDTDTGAISPFASTRNFESAQRAAMALASSTLVPANYQGKANIANCLVAMELANRTGASVLMVMQNLHVIQGRPSWSSAFRVAAINSCGHFSPIRYEVRGSNPDDPFAKDYAVRAYCYDKAGGERLNGEWITWKMVEGEGWNKKSGSKWLTMAGQMFRYRASAFWERAYAPEVCLGMHSNDEVEDFSAPSPSSTGARDLNAALRTIVPAALPATTGGDQAVPSDADEPVDDSDGALAL